jgi:hypothetical protein
LTGNSKFVSMTDATGTRVWSFEDSRQWGNISMPSLSSQEGYCGFLRPVVGGCMQRTSVANCSSSWIWDQHQERDPSG